MTEEELQEFTKAANAANSIFNTIGVMKTAESQIIAKENEAKYNTEVNRVSKQNADNLALRKDFLKDSREDNEAKITSLITDIKRWNVNATDWSNLDDYYQTDEGKGILNDLGVEYGENFDFREKFDTDVNKQLNNTQGLITLQREIIDNLEDKRNQIMDLQDDWLKVKDDANIQGVKDFDDVMEYMQKEENRSRFFTEDSFINVGVPFKDEDQLSPLGKAFMTPKKKTSSGLEYGFVDPAEIKASLAKLSARTDDEIKDEETKWNDMMGHIFRDIGSTENVLTSYDKKGAAEFYKTSGGKVKDYMGTEKMYADEDSALRLKNELENKISKLISWGEDRTMESKTTPGSILDMANQAKINPDSSNSLIRKLHDKVMPTETNQSLYGTGWSSADMTGIDLKKGWGKQQTQEGLLRKYLRAWNLIDKKHPGQWIEYK